MTNPHESTAEAVLAQTGPLGFDNDTAEVAEAAPAVEAPEDTSDPIDIEAEVTAAAEGKRPSWSEAVEVVSQLNPEAAELMRGMMADYTRKTQEAAATRKEVTQRQSELQRLQAQVDAERAALLSVREELAADLPDYDPWNEQSVVARAERAAQERINKMTEAIQREHEARQAELAYSGFLTDHPEFKSDEGLRTDVQKLLEANQNLDLETAYWAVKGQRGVQAAAESKAKRNAERQAKREAARAVGVPRRGQGQPQASKTDLKGMSAADIYRMAKQMHGG